MCIFHKMERLPGRLKISVSLGGVAVILRPSSRNYQFLFTTSFTLLAPLFCQPRWLQHGQTPGWRFQGFKPKSCQLCPVCLPYPVYPTGGHVSMPLALGFEVLRGLQKGPFLARENCFSLLLIPFSLNFASGFWILSYLPKEAAVFLGSGCSI